MKSIAYIGIGSNMGDKLQLLRQTVCQIASTNVSVTKISSLYETEPVDYLDQDWFYNAVIEITTTLSPLALLAHCQAIENNLGKNIKIPKGPRTADLDILFYADQMIASADLIVPHPSALKRTFVLMPMMEIAPDYIPPNDHRTIAAIAAALLGAACPARGPVVRKKMGPEWAAKIAIKP